MGDNLRRLGNQISIAMHADEDGYFAPTDAESRNTKSLYWKAAHKKFRQHSAAMKKGRCSTGGNFGLVNLILQAVRRYPQEETQLPIQTFRKAKDDPGL
jgi:hypothetical protein